ncbi:RHS repeat-associated core domain-containing protein [Actinotalea sp. BY-33]|uniref:RHS repeat-associated core domain-containing protein n=1 Tax=Actinotalea soli TaxID=2819234 RepID=A0A939RUE7_9CELL|nr:RHS repeat-associated core domain-containing protein [Actinotalea soli]MBO1751240.1 RHS repeat-associated core domain-containing protein [Actinotalea soli]
MYTDPYGGARGESTTESVPGDRQFLGKVRDNVTGLTLLGARYYDEAVGRFISVDPVVDLSQPQQWHGYSYANNNPLTLTDPTGYLPGSAMIDGQFGAVWKKYSTKKSSAGGAPAAKASSGPITVGKPARTTVNSIAIKYNAGDYAGVIRDWTPAVQRELANDPNVQVAWTLYDDALSHEKICSEQDCAPPCRELSCELEGLATALATALGGQAGALAARGIASAVGRAAAASRLRSATGATGGTAVSSSVDDLLMPGGSPIGRAGTDASIRVVAGGLPEAQAAFAQLRQGGVVVAQNQKLTRVELPEGGFVQLRTIMSPKSPNTAATIDVDIPGVDIRKVKFNP